ncbi:hypothetical protein PaG_02981 [Moesziomyces aphidis]|uniref:Cytochrome P450 n=1 Tax=Moesziomyces aphidis TaxID=84754 RepID=W3VNF2_MOEAP|nr:hypothetical protein PaG_02981 [Moesziomyces aphidis]
MTGGSSSRSSAEALLAWVQLHPLAALATLVVLYVTYKLAFKPVLFPSALRDLPRPKRASYLLGQRLVEAKGLTYTHPATGESVEVRGPGDVTKHYARTLGSAVYVFPEPFGGETLHIADPYALNAILSDIDSFQSDLLRSSIIEFIVGNGIVTRYGDAHRKQRKLMSPAFSPAHLKALTPTFTAYAERMRSNISAELRGKGGKSVDLAEFLDCTMLDIIGMAGFGYDCRALEKGRQGSELSAAFNAVNQAAIDFGPGRALHLGLSALLYPRAATWPLSEANRRIAKVNRVMDRITMQIVADAKRRVEQEGEEISDKKDLLSLLVKSNLGAGAADRMTDREIGGQIQTFMFAGYETSSVTTSWALYFLSRHPHVQQKLRDLISATLRERKGVGLDDLVPADLGYDDVWCDELRYLDWVLAETLRLCPPVPGNDREAARDAVLPLMTPVTLKDGRKISQLHVPKGARVTIGIKTVNYDPNLFGPDADEFNPDRFANLPQAHANAKLPPYNTYSFIGGPKSWYVPPSSSLLRRRTCADSMLLSRWDSIGAKFALTEMKVLLIVLLGRFAFAPVPGVTIRQHQALIVRPRVESASEGPAAGMPLIVTPLSQSTSS